MKIIMISLALLYGTVVCYAQTKPSPAEQLAHKIARKIKDSLNLNDQQAEQIFQINMQLNERKQAVWKQTTNRDSIQIKSQEIEKGRDALYQRVLNSSQYILYKQKKKTLVSGKKA